LAASEGDVRAAELGRCQSHLKGDASEINLRCKQVGLAPACFSVMVEDPNGIRNPESQTCGDLDYRPFAALWSAPLTYFGTDVPVRDTSGQVQYPVASSQIPQSRLLMTTYSVRDHFRRTVVTPDFPLAHWPALR
jgi:hypothetical protein